MLRFNELEGEQYLFAGIHGKLESARWLINREGDVDVRLTDEEAAVLQCLLLVMPAILRAARTQAGIDALRAVGLAVDNLPTQKQQDRY